MSMYAMLPLAALLMLFWAGGADATACKAGYKDCDKNYYLNGCEINVHTDVHNCGDCGVKCQACANAVPVCKAGKCESACTAPWANCDISWSNGCEVDLSCDTNNCGACGKKCGPVANASAKCSNHQCVYTCNPGWKNCDNNWLNGCETEVNSNVDACGTCGAKCSAAAYSTPTCSNGKCECACSEGWKNCDSNAANGCETKVSSDVNNCGACGAKCKDVPYAVAKCENHKCVYSCRAGWGDCNNNWVDGCECDHETNVEHCGGCGKKCPQPKYFGGEAKCTNGRCETLSCKLGMKYNLGKKCCENDGGKNGGGKGEGGNKGGKQGGKGGSGGRGHY